MAAAKGMALAMNIPIVGVSTFEVIARRLRSEYDRFYLTALVRKGELYLCRVDRETEIRENIGLINQEALPAKIGSMPIAVVGRKPEGWDGLAENIIPDEKTFISGGELALLGAELISAGKVSDLAMLEPLYIAPSQAERKFGRK
jgi:tRNA A37 threonylcarbamoyladenosine modification protein TsaB